MSKPTNQPGVGKVLSLALPIHEAVCTSVWLFVPLPLSVFPTSVYVCVPVYAWLCVCAATQVSSSSISLQFSAKHIIYFAKAKHQASATVAKWFPLSNNMRVCNYTTWICTNVWMNALFEYRKKYCAILTNRYRILNILENIHCVKEWNWRWKLNILPLQTGTSIVKVKVFIRLVLSK